jgi:hypothetical protein
VARAAISTARNISRMVSRQGICASNGIVRCGQADPPYEGFAADGLTGFVRGRSFGFRQPLTASHAILNGGASALTLEHVSGCDHAIFEAQHRS